MTASVLTVAPLAGIDEVRQAWSAFALAQGNPFMTPEWGEAWLAHAELDVAPRFFSARRPDGELAAIIPLVVVRGRHVRTGRLLGFGAANELGPVAAARGDAAARALADAIDAVRRQCDLFVGDSLAGGGWTTRLGGRLVSSEASPVVAGGWDSWESYLASRSGNFRQELRRKERRLLEQGLRYSSVSDGGDLEGALDVLFTLHNARWGSEASPWFAGRERFHRAFARVALERGWLRLRVAQLDGRPVAAYYGLRFGDAEWSYQFGRDPDERYGSIGLLMTAHALREALADGAARFELGPGAQPYKLRFATGERTLETVGLARTLRGRAALIAAERRR